MRLSRAIFAALLCCIAAVASAHDLPIERQAVLQLHPTHAELLLVYNEPPGPRTDRFLALHDANNNGEIDGVEGTLAKPAILRRAFLGLTIEFEQATSKDQSPEVRYKRDKSGGLSTAILRRTDFVPDDKQVDITVSLADREGLPPLDLVIELVEGWQFSDSEATEVKRRLQPGANLEVELKRAEREPDKRPRRNWTPPVLPNVDTL